MTIKALIIGVNGMAGSMISGYLSTCENIEVYTTSRKELDDERHFNLDVIDVTKLEQILAYCRPDVVVNAVGKLNSEVDNDIVSGIYLNSYFPHKLDALSRAYSFKVIHISTDCVFSGKKGPYNIDAEHDGVTRYAKTKSLGEIRSLNHLTIRTSIIGPDNRKNGLGLMKWILNSEKHITGWKNVFWGGVTTLVLARFIEYSIKHSISGLVQLGNGIPISKFDLLLLIAEVYKLDKDLEADYSKSNNKVLIPYGLEGFIVPKYSDMIHELKEYNNDMDNY
jgi:dTDP-4-dehydrorhamnose reductase